MKTTKRILSALMAVLMVLSVFPAGVITLGAEDISLEVEGKDELNLFVGKGVNLLDDDVDLSRRFLKDRIFHTFNSAWVDNTPMAWYEYEYTYITDMSKWAANESASMSASLEASASYYAVSVKAKAQYGMKAAFGSSGSGTTEYAVLSGKYYNQVAKLYFYKDMETVWAKNESGQYRYLTDAFVNDLYTLAPEDFFRMYGTHVLTSFTQGAEAYMVYQGEKLSSATNSMTEENASVSLGVDVAGVAGINADMEAAGAVSKENANENSNIICEAKIRGAESGGFNPNYIKDGTALKDWGSKAIGDIILDENLGLFPIWEFITDIEHYGRKVELEEYFNKQISAQNAEFYGDYIYSGVGQFDYSDFTAISTPEDFNTLLRADLGGNYVLLCDIDLSAYENWTPIGTKDAPFYGTLCGNGNTVTGLQITACADGLAGLFGANDGIIRNLAVEGAIEVDASGSPDNVAYIGGIVGYNTGSIVNCKSEVTVNGEMQASNTENSIDIDETWFALHNAEIEDAKTKAEIQTGTKISVGDDPIRLTGNLNNVTVSIAGSTKPAYIVLEDATISGVIKTNDNSREICIISIGSSNTISGTTEHTPVYSLSSSLYICGNADLTIYGGNGIDGSGYHSNGNGYSGTHGVWAIDVKSTDVELDATLNLIGGRGGDGADGKNGENGHSVSVNTAGHSTSCPGDNGGEGGSGGNGGAPIGGKNNLSVYKGSVYLKYGRGGNGGNGGDGGNGGAGADTTWRENYASHGGNGGAGGNGGNGGFSGCYNSVSICASAYGDATIIIEKADCGNGGNGGGGGSGGRGGHGLTYDLASQQACAAAKIHKPGMNGANGGNAGQGGNGGNGLLAGGKGKNGGIGLKGDKGWWFEYWIWGNKPYSGNAGSDGQPAASSGTNGNSIDYSKSMNPIVTLITPMSEYALHNEQLTWEEANQAADVQGNQKVDWESVFVRGQRAFSAYGSGSPEDVTTTLVAGNPLGYGYTMKITSKTHAAKWHYGGYHHSVMTYPGATFIWKIYAKVPAGYYIYPYSNYLGDNGVNYCLTDNNGTGDWKWYYFATKAGLTDEWDDFSTLGYVAIRSNDFDTVTKEAERNPTWEVAYSNIFEVSGPLALSSLVSIGSATEQALVEKLVSAAGGGEYWIGLKRQANSGADFEKFNWSDGTKTQIVKTGDVTKSYEIDQNGNILDEVYSNWLSGEPDNSSGSGNGEDYIGLYTDNQWADFSASYRMGFITEKRIASSTNTLDANALFVGGICGFNAEGGEIEKVYNKGNINQSKEVDGETKTYKIGTENGGVSAYSGGIAGYNEGEIDGAKNTGNVYAYAESGSAYRYADAYAYGIANKAQNYYSEGTVLATARSVNNLKTIVSEAQEGNPQGLPAEIESNWPEGHSFRLESVSRTDYFVDQKFDPSTVKLTFDDKDVSFSCDVRYNFYKPGHTNVSLIYEKDGKKYTKILPVYVQEASPVSISLNEEKSAYFKASYLKGETFSTQGLIFTLTYENGDTVNIPFKKDDFRIDSPNMNLVGEQTLTVVYVADEVNPLSCTVTISVDSIRTIGIQIAQMPNKTSYYPKEELDWTGMVIERVKNDGSVEVIDIAKEYKAETLKFGYEFKSEGEATVTVIVDQIYTAAFTCTVLPVADSDLPRLEVSNASGSAGYTVQLAVNVKNNPGFSGMSLSYEYDKSAMTLTNVTCSQTAFTLSHDKATVLDAADNWKEDGELVILTFEIAKNAPEGNYNVAIRVNEAYEYSDSGLELVDFYTVDGTLSVVELVYGDADGDGKVGLSDILIIRRHLASRDPLTGISTVWVGVGADANGDGVVNTKDLVLVRKCVASIDPITKEPSFVLGPAA